MPDTWQENMHKPQQRGLSSHHHNLFQSFSYLIDVTELGLRKLLVALPTRSLNCLDRDSFGFQQPHRLLYCRVMSQSRVISTGDLQTAFAVSFRDCVCRRFSWISPKPLQLGRPDHHWSSWWFGKHPSL